MPNLKNKNRVKATFGGRIHRHSILNTVFCELLKLIKKNKYLATLLFIQLREKEAISGDFPLFQ
jgi:hypothetical protein